MRSSFPFQEASGESWLSLMPSGMSQIQMGIRQPREAVEAAHESALSGFENKRIWAEIDALGSEAIPLLVPDEGIVDFAAQPDIRRRFRLTAGGRERSGRSRRF